VNTWSISKSRGASPGGWHRGLDPTNYNFRSGTIRTRMLNVIYFLTDNGPEDGCVVAIPGSHKCNLDLDWHKYKGLEMPGSVPVIGKAGDVFLFSETTIHDGLPKTTEGRRINLYYNYTMRDFNVMTYSPEHNHHFCMPAAIRARFTPQQRDATRWMEYAVADEC
jgi:ectoine hydroxylase-related dioxygenase (phytanoyl-CoA dioxygenase family)